MSPLLEKIVQACSASVALYEM